MYEVQKVPLLALDMFIKFCTFLWVRFACRNAVTILECCAASLRGGKKVVGISNFFCWLLGIHVLLGHT